MLDYHIHTTLCNHAEGTMDAYVQKAVDIGLTEICFLDHLTLQQAGKSLSMALNEVPLYFQAAHSIKKRYQGKIKIKVGLELDFQPELTDLLYEVSSIFAFDVIASSVHFVGGVDIVSHASAWKLKSMAHDDLYEGYISLLAQMLDHDYFDVVCHLDLIKKFLKQPTQSFQKEFNKILSVIKDKQLTVEINTSGYNHPVAAPYPSVDIIKACAEKEIPITLGSDAHRPDSIGQFYNRTMKIICLAGYNHLSAFENRKSYPVNISHNTTQTGRKDI
jgi:histidinol-phosphatase (PHP family)